MGSASGNPSQTRTRNDRQACEAVGAPMITIGDESHAVDFAPDPNAKHRHGFVADESDDAGGNHPRNETDALRVDQALDCLITGEDGTEQDDRDNDHARQILYPPQTIDESFARFAACQHKGNPERDGGHRISDVVDRVGEQRDAARNRHDSKLEDGRDRQYDKRPFDGPDAPRCRRDGGIYRTVCVAMAPAVVMPVTEVN